VVSVAVVLVSYGGLRCTFAQHVGRLRSVGLGQATSLPTVCAAAVPRAVGPLLIGAPTRGGDHTARGGGSRVGDRGATR
jgi:hypothetical protein